MAYDFIAVETKGRVTTVTLNRPAVMNAVNAAMHAELQDAFDAFAADPEAFVCVITGAGERAFCAGSDLKARAAGEGRVYPKNGYAGLIQRFDLYKPLIASVNGICLGGGFEIALACDIIVASETASFGLPEPRVGVMALGGGVHRLVRQIGLKRAMGYLLTGRRMTAAEGHELGLVNEIAPAGELAAVTARWCEAILEAAPMAVRATKEAALRGLDEPTLEAALAQQASWPGFQSWLAAEDTAEGPRAFAEKRQPFWRGR